MKKRIVSIAATAVLVVGLLALAGCGSNSTSSASGSSSAGSADSSKIIKVGAVPTPHAEILRDAVAPLLTKQGYQLEVVEFNDYVLPNTALANHEIDANYFQHVPYLNEFNKEQGTNIVPVATVHFEPFGIYAGKSSSIDTVKSKIAAGDKVTISVPNDTTNEARALLLLQSQGLISLPADAGLTVTAADIVDKPANLIISELEAAQVSRTVQDADLACINGNYAAQAGLSVDNALAVESADSLAASTYANVVCVNAGDESTDKTKALVAAINDDSVRTYIQNKYGNAVVPVF